MRYQLIIEADKPHRRYFQDLWVYRELFWFLAWRDILVRYKQTVIGIAWSVIRPLLAMIVFTVVFGVLMGRAEGDPGQYAVVVYAAMLPWQFFANTFQEGANSLLTNAAMISKVYFPRLIVPTTSMIVSLIDFVISLVILAILMGVFRHVPPARVVLLPLFLALGMVTALGAAFWVSALNVKYRDFRYVVPFVVQFGLYISPVGFTSDLVPGNWRLLYSLNPMVGVIDGFRWCLLGADSAMYWPGVFLSLILSFLLFVSGVAFFRGMERDFADVI
ncbi:MAG: ABC transporter permease [Lentisphaeria bacterium]|nr:ABC transporter permease [Lentisphaeria bacterium]